MGTPRFTEESRRDKNTERTQVRLPFQLKAHIEAYARLKGYTIGQAMRELIARGLHVEHYTRDHWFVETLEGD